MFNYEGSDMRDYNLPGIGDYEEPEVETSADDDGWYLFNEDRSPGWDETEEW